MINAFQLFVSLGSLGVGARIYPFGLFCIVQPNSSNGWTVSLKHETDDAGVGSHSGLQEASDLQSFYF